MFLQTMRRDRCCAVLRDLTPDQFDIPSLQLLVKGAEGVVYKAVHKPSGQLRAVKFFHRPGAYHCGRREHSMLQRIADADGPCIANVLDAGFDEYADVAFIVMDFFATGDLHDWMRASHNHEALPDQLAVSMTRDLVRAIHFLHTRVGIVHGDIKPENVMVRRSESSFHAEVVDFGLSWCATMDPDAEGVIHSEWTPDLPLPTLPNGQQGTSAYMSPEVIVDGIRGPWQDWWAVGLVAGFMAFGPTNNPFDCEDPLDVILAESYEIPSESYDTFPEEFCDFISLCLEKERSSRMSDTSAESHPFSRGLVWNDMRFSVTDGSSPTPSTASQADSQVSTDDSTNTWPDLVTVSSRTSSIVSASFTSRHSTTGSVVPERSAVTTPQQPVDCS